ncbi:ABC transporter ATP-binding protein [Phaeovulum sp.]|uniref:ABC transporter ATP-binding protein n=1 Tax=Phaeovulum sp. TaxID=2934796 RepID=UPI0039E2A6A9
MLLECDAVKKAFDDAGTRVPVLRGVSFGLKAGDTLALTGESGSGKSTLLHIAAGLEPADAGSVRFLGRAIEDLDDRARAKMRRCDIALVFQQFNLIPSLSVAANITFHARLAERLDPDLTDTIIAAFGLGDQLEKYPEALSGGQQQRVAIARALAARPKLLLADEPTGNLDEETADRVMAQMLTLVDQTGAGLIVVSHSEKVAAGMARRLHLSGGRLA